MSQPFTPLNEQAKAIVAALSGTDFEARPGYFSSQNFCLAVPVGSPVRSFKLGRLLAGVEADVSYDLWPNGMQYVVFPDASVRLG